MAYQVEAHAVDDVADLRNQFQRIREQHGHIRANARRRLKEAITQLECECKEYSQLLDLINSMLPDVTAPDTLPADYGAEAPSGWRR